MRLGRGCGRGLASDKREPVTAKMHDYSSND
jgi:hypothetical protein